MSCFLASGKQPAIARIRGQRIRTCCAGSRRRRARLSGCSSRQATAERYLPRSAPRWVSSRRPSDRSRCSSSRRRGQRRRRRRAQRRRRARSCRAPARRSVRLPASPPITLQRRPRRSRCSSRRRRLHLRATCRLKCSSSWQMSEQGASSLGRRLDRRRARPSRRRVAAAACAL